jgi:hypothetical protein
VGVVGNSAIVHFMRKTSCRELSPSDSCSCSGLGGASPGLAKRCASQRTRGAALPQQGAAATTSNGNRYMWPGIVLLGLGEVLTGIARHRAAAFEGPAPCPKRLWVQ